MKLNSPRSQILTGVERRVVMVICVWGIALIGVLNLRNLGLDLSRHHFHATLQTRNTAPKITAAILSPLGQGSQSKLLTVANVSDAETAAGDLQVTVGALPAGVTVASVTNASGVVTARLTLACDLAVGALNLPLIVTDGGGLSAAATLVLTVESNTPPTLGAYGLATMNINNSIEFSPFSQQTDNGVIQSITASAPDFTGTLSVNVNSGVVSIAKAGPVGQFTVTLTATDNCGAASTTQFKLIVLQAGIPLEADVTPRTTGNGAVTIADWTQVGRFVAGLDSILESSEFQRADCAPRGTVGDGKLTVADWVQAGRYAAGLDSVVMAGGPTATANLSGHWKTDPSPSHPRSLRLSPRVNVNDRVVSVPLEFNAQGNENGLSFILEFDSHLLSFSNLVYTAPLIGVSTAPRPGQLGIMFAQPAGKTFASGTLVVATLKFLLSEETSSHFTTKALRTGLSHCTVVDANARTLAVARWSNAEMTVSSPDDDFRKALNPNAFHSKLTRELSVLFAGQKPQFGYGSGAWEHCCQ